jgi:hypothetical protein
MAGSVACGRVALLTVALVAFLAPAGETGEPGARGARRIRLSRPGMTNVIDASLFDLAEFYLNEGRTDDGIRALERIARETTDREMRSLAHFNLAGIHETTRDDPGRARAEYAKVTGPMAAAARGKVLGPLRNEKRWTEAIDFLRECLAVCEEPSEKADVLRTMTAIAKSSGDSRLKEETLRSIPDLITYREAVTAAETDRRKIEEMRRRAQASRVAHPTGPAAARRPPVRPPVRPQVRRAVRPAGGGVAAPARPARSEAQLEAQIRELERAGFDEEVRRLRKELRELRESKNPEQF